MKRKESKMRKIIVLTGCVLSALGLSVGGYFGAKAIYENGIQTGRQQVIDEMSGKVKGLAIAVSEKTNFQQQVATLFAELPSEVNAESIDDYIAQLNDLINKTNTEQVKTTLTNYLEEWNKFKEIYASEDNNAITESFNALKTTTKNTAADIKSLFDEAIKTAIDSL